LLSIKAHIKEDSDKFLINKIQERYSYVRKHLYNNYSTIPTKDMEDYVKEKFKMNDIEARSVISEVDSFYKKIQLNKEEIYKRIAEITKLLKEIKEKKKKSKKDKRNEFKLENKLTRLIKSLSKDITFGGKEELKNISRLSNQLINSMKDSDDFDFEIYRKLNQAKEEFKTARLNPIYLIGEANQKGNRFFDFDLTNNKIIYKPKKGIKIEIVITDKRKKLLEKLQELIDNKLIAISIYISNDSISLSYDDSIVSGYFLDKKSRSNEIRELKNKKLDKETEKLAINEIYVKYYKILEEKKIKGKRINRYFSFDTNPNFIGCSILEKNKDGSFTIIKVFYYDLSDINNIKKTELNTTNKRIHGIKHVWKDIFDTINHYKCSSLVKEKLTFNKKEIKENKEFNRQTKNVWYRTLSNHLINKYCTQYGIIQIEINAVYSSTIGNLIYNYVDCINAAIEIGRRGIFKFIKDTFYPCLTKTDFHAMSRLNTYKSRDVEMLKDCYSWKEIHSTIISLGLRYRKSLNDLSLIGCTKKYTKSSKLLHSNIIKIMF